MLSQGKHPNLFRLQEQQYNLMAAEYLKEWNQEFPLKKFSAAVYEMRLEDKQALPADEFHQVAMSLSDEKYKMVVSRQWEGEKGEAKKEWYFRHDKIMDFFLVQNFLGETDAAEGLLVDRIICNFCRGLYPLLGRMYKVPFLTSVVINGMMLSSPLISRLSCPCDRTWIEPAKFTSREAKEASDLFSVLTIPLP